MTSNLEQQMQLIGELSVVQSYDGVGKILLYAEIEDGVSSADIIYVVAPANARFQFCNDALRQAVISFWENWQKVPGNREWRCMEYVIENGKFTMDLTYPDEIDDSRPAFARRPAIILKHFGNAKIDYSNPE